jgi:glucoamylase
VYLVANVNVNNGRTGKDANTMLGPISVFDLRASCDSPSVQPCHSQALASFKVWVDTFRDPSLYPINSGIPANEGVALGRYPEDVYFGGNPWYLITFGAAEFLYDAVAQWNHQHAITIDVTSLAFFKDLYPDAKSQTYRKCNKNSEFAKILQAVAAYADSFAAIGEKYTPADGSLAEQFNKTFPGNPLSAADLTWSYAAFVTMAERRAGQYPPSWLSSSASPPPTTCVGSSTPGIYVPALAAGAPNVTASCTVPVTFAVNASTYFGEDVYLVGSTADLGSWSVDNAQPLTASNYTAARPLWFAEVEMSAGETASYVYVRRENCNQGYIYETTNRTFVVPECNAIGSEGLATDDAWVGPVGSSGNC